MVRLWGLIVLVALLPGGCSPEVESGATGLRSYSAAVKVRLEWMNEFTLASGFYRLRLLKPDGTSIEGFGERRVDFVPGDQEVTVALGDGALFGNNDSVVFRLAVEALPGEGSSPVASGTGLLTVEDGKDFPGLVEVELYPDPRPLDAAMLTGSFGTAPAADQDQRGRLLSLRWLGAPPEEFSYHLWDRSSGEPVYLRKLNPAAKTEVQVDTSGGLSLLDSEVEFMVTAEAEDITGPLATPLGWRVYQGSGPRESDRETINTARGISADLFRLIGAAQKHAGFAAASRGTEASVLGHTEHVWNYLAGRAHRWSEDQDFNGNGTKEYPGVEDRTGVHGYLAELEALLDSEFESLELAEAAPREVAGIVLRLNACAKNLEDTGTETAHVGSAVGRVFDSIANYQMNFTGEGSSDALVVAVEDLLGDFYDSAAHSLEGMPRQTGRCIEDRIEALSTFVFRNRSPGEDG